MMVRKQTAVSGLRRSAEGRRNSIRGRDERDGIREKRFREASEKLGRWSEDRRKYWRVLRTKSFFCKVKFVDI